MSGKWMIVAVLSYGVLNESGLYAAVPAKIGTSATVTAVIGTTSDLRPTLAKMRTENKLVQGKNLVLTTKAQGATPSIQLWATVNNGAVTKWQAVDANGNNLPTNTNTVVQYTKTACVVCITLADGHDHCYEIDCKDLPKPKPKDKTKTAIQ